MIFLLDYISFNFDIIADDDLLHATDIFNFEYMLILSCMLFQLQINISYDNMTSFKIDNL